MGRGYWTEVTKVGRDCQNKDFLIMYFIRPNNEIQIPEDIYQKYCAIYHRILSCLWSEISLSISAMTHDLRIFKVRCTVSLEYTSRPIFPVSFT